MFPKRYYKLYRKYPENCLDQEWAMDGRHIMILFNILISFPFKRVLEIGSHYGCSTTAFVEALNLGSQFEVHLCDINIENEVKKICDIYNMDKQLFYHECKSSDYLSLAPIFDFALLDGSHVSEHVQDEFEYLSMNRTQSYLLHDTKTQLLAESKETPWFDGPLLLMNKLKSSPDWLWIEDSEDRINEKTKRGLFFATKNIYQYNKAKEVFEYWCNLSEIELFDLLH